MKCSPRVTNNSTVVPAIHCLTQSRQVGLFHISCLKRYDALSLSTDVTFLFFQEHRRIWGPFTSYLVDAGGSVLGSKVDKQLSQAPELRMSGTISLLLHTPLRNVS